MKWKKILNQYLDVIIACAIGAFAIGVSFNNNFSIIRIIFGFIFIFFASGYPISTLFFRKTEPTLLEKIITSSLISILLLYPAGVLTTIFEGKTSTAIFQRHITHSLTTLWLLQIISIIITIWLTRKNKRKPIHIKRNKIPFVLLVSLIIYSFFTLTNLNRADVLGDEYDLGYQTYNLIDGTLVGRQAYTISFNTHPPLTMHVKHFTMQILNPSGLDNLQDWQFRVTEAILGALTIVYTYTITRTFFSKKVANLAVLFLAVNNYMVFMGRFFERSIYLTPFAIASIYWILKYFKDKNRFYLYLCGLSLGGAFLVKASALTVALPVAILLLYKKEMKALIKVVLLVCLVNIPVVIYNLVGLVTIGFVDSNFSRFLGIKHPFATPIPEKPLLVNPPTMLSLLTDQYSVFVMIIFIFALIYVIRKQSKSLTEWVLLIWTGSIILFFSFTMIRAYYMVFITIPLVIFSAQLFERIKEKRKMLSTTFISLTLIYSAFYSYKTNIDSSYTISRKYNDSGSTGTPHLISSLNRHYSISARAWTENWGWKKLIKSLDLIVSQNDCLIVKNNLNNLAVRRYLWTNDKVKEFFLEANYSTKYPRCSPDTQLVDGNIFLLSDNDDEVGNLDKIFNDSSGIPRFYLFILEKGNYS